MCCRLFKCSNAFHLQQWMALYTGVPFTPLLKWDTNICDAQMRHQETGPTSLFWGTKYCREFPDALQDPPLLEFNTPMTPLLKPRQKNCWHNHIVLISYHYQCCFIFPDKYKWDVSAWFFALLKMEEKRKVIIICCQFGIGFQTLLKIWKNEKWGFCRLDNCASCMAAANVHLTN